MNNKIIWEKWVDPYLPENVESQWPDYEESQHRQEDVEDAEDNDNEPEIKRHLMYAISSPMGIIPYNEYSAPSKVFNFWVGHTNFNITQPVANIIESTEGIEILDIFTRYRFRIAIGKNFKDRNVMNTVNKLIGIYLHEQ
tara:strand:+ start:115 stop:534 length:420 start_codon:yes stop_codon:yes gene_type:complete